MPKKQQQKNSNLHNNSTLAATQKNPTCPSLYFNQSPSALKAHVLNFECSLLNFKPMGPPCLLDPPPHVPRILNTVIRCRLESIGNGGCCCCCCCWTSTSILSSSRNGFTPVGGEEGGEEELTLSIHSSTPFHFRKPLNLKARRASCASKASFNEEGVGSSIAPTFFASWSTWISRSSSSSSSSTSTPSRCCSRRDPSRARQTCCVIKRVCLLISRPDTTDR